MEHPVPPMVFAYPVFGVYASYDGQVPNTEDLWFVSSKELAEEVVKHLNKDPRAVVEAVVEGYEWCKLFEYRPAFVASDQRAQIFTSLQSLVDNLETDV